MLKRWYSRVYNIQLLLGILEVILDSTNIEDKSRKRKRIGRDPEKSSTIYIKALVLKEMYKASLRHAEFLALSILGVRIPKSTLNWEVNYRFLIKEVKDTHGNSKLSGLLLHSS